MLSLDFFFFTLVMMLLIFDEEAMYVGWHKRCLWFNICMASWFRSSTRIGGEGGRDEVFYIRVKQEEYVKDFIRTMNNICMAFLR